MDPYRAAARPGRKEGPLRRIAFLLSLAAPASSSVALPFFRPSLLAVPIAYLAACLIVALCVIDDKGVSWRQKARTAAWWPFLLARRAARLAWLALSRAVPRCPLDRPRRPGRRVSSHDWRRTPSDGRSVIQWECARCGNSTTCRTIPPPDRKVLLIGEAEWDDRWLSCDEYVLAKVLRS